MNYEIKTFEQLKLNELYDILKLRNEVFIVEQNCPYQDIDDKDKISYHIFLKEQESIVAYLRVLPKKATFEEMSIGRVLVKENKRSLGLARPMVQTAIDFITNEKSEHQIRISAQAYLIKFYQSLGFEAVSEIYLEDDIEHIEMLYEVK